MIIKSFVAESAAAALKQIRQEMGGEAIVLKTKQITSNRLGNQVEVTACLEKPSVAAASKITQPASIKTEPAAAPVAQASPSATVTAKVNPQVAGQLERMEMKLNSLLGLSLRQEGKLSLADQLWQVRTRLENADLLSSQIERFMSQLFLQAKEDVPLESTARELLRKTLNSHVEASLTFKAGDRMMVFGAPAVGKSSMLGKAALQAVYKTKLPVTVTSLDDFKIGAREELATYADALNLSVAEPSLDKIDLSKYKRGLLLIDTPSLHPNSESITALRTGIEKLEPNYRIAVISAMHRSRDLSLQVDAIKQCRPTHLGVTMLDLTRRYGAILTAAELIGCPIALVTDTPGGIGELGKPDIERIISGLLIEEGEND